MVQNRSYIYNISSNGAAGDWYWDVTWSGEVIARGLAATEALARAEAMTAAVSDVVPAPEETEDDAAPYLDDLVLPAPSIGAA
jgi:hypothetical protein